MMATKRSNKSLKIMSCCRKTVGERLGRADKKTQRSAIYTRKWCTSPLGFDVTARQPLIGEFIFDGLDFGSTLKRPYHFLLR